MVVVLLTFFSSLALWGLLFVLHRSVIRQDYKKRTPVQFQVPHQPLQAKHSLIPYVIGFLFVPLVVIVIMVQTFGGVEFKAKVKSSDIQTIFIFIFLSLSVLIYFIRNSKRLRW